MQRFESLRSYGVLPRGRENRGKVLSRNEIAAAILGLTTVHPKWAGHAALLLSKLKVSGANEAMFFGTSTLQETIAHILSDEKARGVVSALSVSLAERATNSHGYAVLFYQAEGVARRALYGRREVLTVASPTNETLQIGTLHSPTFREMGFNHAFFERVARAIEDAKASVSPAGDGSEYDSEEAQQERYKRLGVTRFSRFLNIGVDNQVTWPRSETLVKFDRYQFVLMPKTEDHVQSIHVDLSANRLTDTEAVTVINRFLSVMTWCDDQFAIPQDGWSGNPVPVPVSKRDLAFTTATNWIFDRKLPSTESSRRALALYREARNAEQNYMVSYAVLNYYKIIEIGNHGKAAVKNWFRTNYETVIRDNAGDDALRHFSAICGGEKPHEYIYESCRIAVAHSGKYSKSDPDDANELRRLHIAAEVLCMFARQFIRNELGISEMMYSGD